MNHATPGNWQASNPQHAPGSELYSHEVSERGSTVAICYGGTVEEARDNAALCAMAPRMREALECLATWANDNVTDPAAIIPINQARALLATLPR